MKRLLIISLLTVVASVTTIHAAVFNDGFENGFKKWDAVYDSPTAVTADKIRGEYAAEFEGGYEAMYMSGNQRGDGLTKLFGGTVTSASCSGYIKPLEWADAFADIHTTFVDGGDGISIGAAWMWGPTGGYYIDAANRSSMYWTHSLPVGQWTAFRVEFDTANNGTYRYFENDQLMLTIPNFGTNVQGFFLGSGGCCGPVKYLADDISCTWKFPKK